MTAKQVKVYSPGSIANLGPGFDVFGLAIQGLGDQINLIKNDNSKINIIINGTGSDNIPTNPEKNSAGAIVSHIIKEEKLKFGFTIEINKGIPPSTGMGSSGASAAAVSVALNQLLGLNLSKRELVELASIGEAAVAGSPHADNVSASIFGGFVIVGDNMKIYHMDAPDIGIVVVVPDIYIPNKTKVARGLLPDKVPLKDAVHNIRNASLMTMAVVLKDPVLFGKCINDRVVEPYRAEMIPNFWEVKDVALEAGAYGCSISGGGPSLFAVGENLIEIGKAMKEAFGEIETNLYFTKPSNEGAKIL